MTAPCNAVVSGAASDGFSLFAEDLIEPRQQFGICHGIALEDSNLVSFIQFLFGFLEVISRDGLDSIKTRDVKPSGLIGVDNSVLAKLTKDDIAVRYEFHGSYPL
jgi:hypothetical protein